MISTTSDPAARRMVVIVDDDPAVGNSLKFSLEIEGYTALVYGSGAAVLESADLPNAGCIVIDFYLPDMDGLDLLAQLRERGVHLAPILITTEPSAILRGRAEKAGAPIVEKPLLNSGLSDAIRRAVSVAARDQP